MLRLTQFLEELKSSNINPIGLSIVQRETSAYSSEVINYHHLIEMKLHHQLIMAGWPCFDKKEIDLQTFFKENTEMYYVYILIETLDFEKIKKISQFKLQNFKENRINKGFFLSNVDFYMKTIC